MAMNETKKVLVNFIQDRSGSMQTVWEETLSGFRAFVNELKEQGPKDNVEYLFSLTTFDTIVDTPVIAVPIASVDLGVLAKHGPRGGTALYDAVGATIQNTEANRHGCSKIVCVIVTDGQENSSREWTKDRLHTSIEGHLNAGDWTFTYLGTQPETWGDAGVIGVGVGSVSSYTPTMAHAAYAATACAVNSMSASASLNSRSLMRDHLSPEMERSSGMKVDRTDSSGLSGASGIAAAGLSGIPGSGSWTQPTNQVAPPAKTNRRWKN
jgi:uncharacterized protein YegL